MTRPRGASPGPQLAVIDGEGTRAARSGRNLGPITPPEGCVLDEKQKKLWDQYVADNPYLDEQDGALAYMWCLEYARYLADPRGMSASEKNQMLKMMNDLYLSAAERNRKTGGGDDGPKRGTASRFLSKRKE